MAALYEDIAMGSLEPVAEVNKGLESHSPG